MIVCLVYSMFSLAVVNLRLASFRRTSFGLCIHFFIGTCYAKYSLLSMEVIVTIYSFFSLVLVL